MPLDDFCAEKKLQKIDMHFMIFLNFWVILENYVLEVFNFSVLTSTEYAFLLRTQKQYRYFRRLKNICSQSKISPVG